MTIGEYIQAKQPRIWLLLVQKYLCYGKVDWKQVMETPYYKERGKLNASNL